MAAAPQADYSQQWIEYYRSLGLHNEADAIEQQIKAKVFILYFLIILIFYVKNSVTKKYIYILSVPSKINSVSHSYNQC